MRNIMVVFAGFLIVLALVLTGEKLIGNSMSESQVVMAQKSQLVTPKATPTRSMPAIPTPFLRPTKVLSTATVEVIEPTPTPEPVVSNYVFGKQIDLSSGAPVALTIHLGDDKLLISNWAGTVSYKDTDDPKTVFSPNKGIVYSYLGDVTTTWAHSGINIYGQRYFATNLDIYIRKNEDSKTMSLSEATARADSLKGMTAVLCQDESGKVKPLSDFDALGECPGKQVQMEIVAVAVIPREMVDGYDSTILDLNQWLMDNFPEAGFDQLGKEDGWLVRFCIGKLSDQVSDGTPSYEYNRGVIGFKIKDGE